MASLLVPTPKTVSDIMEDELYHVPNCPIQLASNRSDSPQPLLLRSLSNTNTGSMNGGSGILAASTLSSLLNIPDTFVEQYQRLSNTGNNASGFSPTHTTSDDCMISLQEHSDGIVRNNFGTDVNPFADYGNPDSLNTQHQTHSFVRPQDVSTRRRRITTLEEDTMQHNKPMNEEEYYLFNPDIQPSQLIFNKNMLADQYMYSDSLFINLQSSLHNEYDTVDSIQGNYMDNFDEEVEEDISDDDDDDNYFYDDFDDLIPDHGDEAFYNSSVTEEATDSSVSACMRQKDIPRGYIENSGVRNLDSLENFDNLDIVDDDEDGMLIDDVDEAPVKTLEDLTPDTSREASEEYESNPSENQLKTMHSFPKSEVQKTAAEISAQNPSHQCDLVNPLTGQPCYKQFSRPYDLIRHQETIHAAKKKIFRCVLCEGRVNGGTGNGKLKTFSRGDALSRHIKVKHGLVGKEAVNIINEAKENVEYVYA